jgi:predicted FMN-binding regulatory protein PaiB
VLNCLLVINSAEACLMYLPEHFKEEDCAELAALMQRYPLATLIAAGDDGELEVNHIPLEYAHADGQYGVLRGHIAKANPLAQLLEKPRSVYAVFHADQAYISPNGYPSKLADHRAVPTWNYRAVHVKGQIRIKNGINAARFSQQLSQRIRFCNMPSEHAVLPIRMRILQRNMIDFKFAIISSRNQRC